MKLDTSLFWLRGLAAAAMLGFVGCQPAASDSKGDGEAPPAAEESSEESDDSGEVSAIELDETVLANLSDEDQVLVRKQLTCPVGGHSLTGMGTPIAMEYEGEKVFLCCDGCKDAFEAEPAKFAAIAHGDHDHADGHDHEDDHDHADGDHDH